MRTWRAYFLSFADVRSTGALERLLQCDTVGHIRLAVNDDHFRAAPAQSGGSSTTLNGASTAANGNITVVNQGGSLTVAGAVSAGGSGQVQLVTTGANDVTINAAVTGGSADIISGGNTTVGADVTVGGLAKVTSSGNITGSGTVSGATDARPGLWAVVGSAATNRGRGVKGRTNETSASASAHCCATEHVRRDGP